MKIQDTKFDLNDIAIKAADISYINSRNDTDVYVSRTLPLMNAPMYSVINHKPVFNKDILSDLLYNKIVTVLPREYDISEIPHEFFQFVWISISLQTANQFSDFYKENKFKQHNQYKILIDIANGNMSILMDAIRKIKSNYSNITIMAGNVANPTTYKYLSDAGADYVRISVGSGTSCLSAVQTAIYYPMASIIKECYDIKKQENTAKIVADGGFSNYSDIIKALTLGADYVMIGSILTKSIESDNIPYLWKFIPIRNIEISKFLFNLKLPLYKKHFGMSTKMVQKMWNKGTLRSSEGTVVWNKVSYTLSGWCDNFIDYLKSTMSYTNSKNLDELKDSEIILISQNSFKRFNK